MTPTHRPPLAFWQIWNMSFGFFGIQFGWGLQMANMSAIYQYLGAREDQIAWLWIAAPLTGLLVQPLVGYFSDRTWCGLGRRRPYFLGGAILSSLALIAMPNASALWMAAGLLWILDASINITMEPFRAFVGDLLPQDQRKSGFAMQSLLIGLGAVLSSALPYLLTHSFGVSREATADSAIPPAVRLAFYFGSGVFFVAVLYTILTTREHPPGNLEAFRRMKAESAGLGRAFREIFQGIGSMPKAMRQLAVVQFFTWFALFCMWIYFVPAVGKGVFGGTPLGVHDPTAATALETAEGRPYLARAIRLAQAYEDRRATLSAEAQRQAATHPWYDPVLQMLGLSPAAPDPGAQISEEALRQLLASPGTWNDSATTAANSSPMIQNFAAVLQQHEITRIEAPGLAAAAARIHQDLAKARRYQEGVAWGGVCFSAYNGTAFVFAFGLLALVRRFTARSIHRICLVAGGTGLLLAVVWREPRALLCSMLLVGIAWASILSMPYAMLSNAIPAAKMGFYMGVFNFFIVLPQILASAGLGTLMKSVLHDNPMNAVLLGGGSMILAGLSVSLVSTSVDAAEPITPS